MFWRSTQSVFRWNAASAYSVGHGQSVKIKSRGWMQIKENEMTLEGSFSAVSTATIARVGAFCSIFRDLQDYHTFAPRETENRSKKSSNFFATFQKIYKIENFVIFQQFSSNFAPILIKFSRNFAKYLRKFWGLQNFLNFCWIPTNFPTFWPNFNRLLLRIKYD